MKEEKNIFPKSDTMQRVRDLGRLSPKWDVSIKSLTFGFRESLGRVSKKDGQNQRIRELCVRLCLFEISEATSIKFLSYTYQNVMLKW